MAPSPKVWRTTEIIQTASHYLSEKGVENARLNAERIIGKVLDIDRVALYLNFDRPLQAAELKEIKSLLARRGNGEPLQYILKKTEFMSLEFVVDSSVLIPRPETELLVETVLEKCRGKFAGQRISILDIGTGSGCIAISLAHYLPECHVTAVDVSASALATAQVNAQQLQADTRVAFAKLDILSSTITESFQERFDVIVSNPPYVSKDEYLNLPLEVKNFEPVIALCDQGDGLLYYRRLAATVPDSLTSNGMLAVEIGAAQASAVQGILAAVFQRVECLQDLNGLDRVIVAEDVHANFEHRLQCGC